MVSPGYIFWRFFAVELSCPSDYSNFISGVQSIRVGFLRFVVVPLVASRPKQLMCSICCLLVLLLLIHINTQTTGFS